MTQFIMSSSNPERFRTCQLNYQTSEFCDGKKKLFDLKSNSNEANLPKNLFQQKYNQGQSQLIIAGRQFANDQKKTQLKDQKQLNASANSNYYQNGTKNLFQNGFNFKDNNNNYFKLTKCQQKNLKKKLVYPIKIGKDPVLPFRNVQSAKARINVQLLQLLDKYIKKKIDFCKQDTESIEEDQRINAPIRKEIYQTEGDQESSNMDFFNYLHDLNYRPPIKILPKGPQFRGNKLYTVEADRLDRLEQDSSEAALKIKGLSLLDKQKIKQTKKVNGNSLVLGQGAFEYAASDAGKKMIAMLQEYNKTKGKPIKEKSSQKGKRSEMSSGYPPMFDKAKYTKSLYYNTTYNNFFTPQTCYSKPGFRFGTVQFKKTYVPTLFNQ